MTFVLHIHLLINGTIMPVPWLLRNLVLKDVGLLLRSYGFMVTWGLH